MKRIELFGLSFLPSHSVEAVAKDVMGHIACPADQLPLMITPNVDQIVKLNRPENASLKMELSKAQWILADGQPIVSFSKLKMGNEGLPARLTGSDFFPVLWKMLLDRVNEPVYFVLPSEELGRRFQGERENVHFYAPPFFNLQDAEQSVPVMDSILSDIKLNKPRYVFIGLGFPKQEHIALHIFKHIDKTQWPKVFLLGASFEFYFGLKKRAPVIWQKLGIEFLHRLLSEPRRMAKRYLVDDVAFLGIALKEWRK